jgi:hypothetical protein
VQETPRKRPKMKIDYVRSFRGRRQRVLWTTILSLMIFPLGFLVMIGEPETKRLCLWLILAIVVVRVWTGVLYRCPACNTYPPRGRRGGLPIDPPANCRKCGVRLL